LIPLDRRTKEEQKKIATKGGIASGKARLANKTFKQIAHAIANSKPHNDLIDELCDSYPDIPRNEMTNKIAMMDVAFKMAMSGDLKAIEMFRDTAGEAPVKRNEHEHNGKIELPIINVNYTKSETKTIEGEIIQENSEK